MVDTRYFDKKFLENLRSEILIRNISWNTVVIEVAEKFFVKASGETALQARHILPAIAIVVFTSLFTVWSTVIVMPNTSFFRFFNYFKSMFKNYAKITINIFIK